MEENHIKLGLVKKQESRVSCGTGSLELWESGAVGSQGCLGLLEPRDIDIWGQNTQGYQDVRCRTSRALDSEAVGRPRLSGLG